VDKAEFERRLLLATEEAITFARRFVSDDMPARYRYVVFVFRCSNVEYRQDEFEAFTVLLTTSQVASCFLKGNRVSRRVEIGVHSVENQTTVLRLISANDDFVNTMAELHNPVFGPFKIIGPIAGWRYPGVDENNRLHPRPEFKSGHTADYFDE
jgi:hypothetical protein